MSIIQAFSYQDQPVRTTTVNGQPAFIAADLLGLLELNRSSAALLDEDEKGVHTVDTLGGAQQMAYVTEAGMYSLVLRSRKPEAKAFKRWITHEVLPQIRKTGAYAVKEISRLELIDMARESEVARIAESHARELAESRVLELAGPATAWEKLASAKGDLDVRDAAQVLCRDHNIQIGRNRLFGWLRANRWIDANNRPYQNRVDQGLLTEKVGTFVIQRSAGEMLAPPQLRITAKGLQRLQAELSPKALVA
jgi:anti-repressor protein